MDAADRPDILGVASSIAEELLLSHEAVRLKQFSLEKRLEKEKKRTQKHYSKANDYMHSYQKLFIVSQEKYDKLANSQTSMAESRNGPPGIYMVDSNNNHTGNVTDYS